VGPPVQDGTSVWAAPLLGPPPGLLLLLHASSKTRAAPQTLSHRIGREHSAQHFGR